MIHLQAQEIMSNKLLTKEIAEKFLACPDEIDLYDFTAIEDEAAESLSNHQGELALTCIAELSDAAAESLSRHQGHSLILNRLTKLSDAAAASLSRVKGDLTLGGITELSDTAAEALSHYKGPDLWLHSHSLTELSDAAAESLSRLGSRLLLNGLIKLSDAAEKSLSKARWDPVRVFENDSESETNIENKQSADIVSADSSSRPSIKAAIKEMLIEKKTITLDGLIESLTSRGYECSLNQIKVVLFSNKNIFRNDGGKISLK